MPNVQKFIFPAVILASFFIIVFTRLISAPQVVVSASSENSQSSERAHEGQTDVADSEQTRGCSIGSRYPEDVRRWCYLIETASVEHGLPADLIAAVILQESGGNPDAYSKSGAVGLMQVMPRDGIAGKFVCLNGPCFTSRPSMEELYDPKFNIAYGTRMLAGLVGKTGDLREALSAYGPMDVGYSYADLVLNIYENYRD